MAVQSPPLTDVLTEPTASRVQKKRPLTGGLILAYTPGSLNKTEPGVYRLTLSRRGVWPSELEIQTVKRDLRTALEGAGRNCAGLFVEEFLRGRPARRPSERIYYHVVFWRELRQANLF